MHPSMHGGELWSGRRAGQGHGAESSHSGSSVNSQADQSRKPVPGESGLNVHAPPFPPQNTTSLYMTANKTVLLQTACTDDNTQPQPAISLPGRLSRSRPRESALLRYPASC